MLDKCNLRIVFVKTVIQTNIQFPRVDVNTGLTNNIKRKFYHIVLPTYCEGFE